MAYDEADKSSIELTDARAARGATHPRITLDFMLSQISCVAFTTGDKFVGNASLVNWEDKRVYESWPSFTICMMTMRNGFIVLGKSAPLSPQNFNADKGRTFAYEDCLRQLWPLYAFSSKQNATEIVEGTLR